MLQITGGSKQQPIRAASTMSDENGVPGGKVAEVLSGSGGVASVHRRLCVPWSPCPFRTGKQQAGNKAANCCEYRQGVG